MNDDKKNIVAIVIGVPLGVAILLLVKYLSEKFDLEHNENPIIMMEGFILGLLAFSLLLYEALHLISAVIARLRNQVKDLEFPWKSVSATLLVLVTSFGIYVCLVKYVPAKAEQPKKTEQLVKPEQPVKPEKLVETEQLVKPEQPVKPEPAKEPATLARPGTTIFHGSRREDLPGP